MHMAAWLPYLHVLCTHPSPNPAFPTPGYVCIPLWMMNEVSPPLTIIINSFYPNTAVPGYGVKEVQFSLDCFWVHAQ